jgi:cytochrome P450
MSPLQAPGPKGVPFLGVAPAFSVDRLDTFNRWRDEYGDIVRLPFTFGTVAYLLNDPDLVKFVLVEHPEYVHKTPLFKRATRDSIGQGLLTSEGDFHKRQRRLIQPAFHHQRIAVYAQQMVDLTSKMLGAWRTTQQIDIHEAMMHLTMDIVAKALFNADVSGDAESIGQAISRGLERTNARTSNPLMLPAWVPTPQNRRDKANQRILDGVINRFIEHWRTHGEDRGDLLSMLLMAQDEDGSGMSDTQVRHEALTLFIAGHETTANTLTWSFYLLARHPEVNRKLSAELDVVLGGRTPTMGDLPNLPYTNQVIKESMRLYPPAWIVPRMAITNFEMNGYAINKQNLIFTSPYTMHRHPRYYSAPHDFIPERWTETFEKGLPKYAYFPFGGGPRVCIGNSFAMMEAQLVLATIAQRWQLDLLPNQTITPEPMITLRPKEGIHMRLTARVPTPQSQALEYA